MAYLVRKINIAKWDSIENGDSSVDVSADAITQCLNTKKNTISLWFIPSIEQLIDAAVAMTSKKGNLESEDFVCIPLDDLKDFTIDSTPGDTLYTEFANNHRDMTQLTYIKLGILKDLILKSLNTNNYYKRYTKTELKEHYHHLIKNSKLNKEELKFFI